jgi:PAS domain S-box-containing protein
LSESEERFRCLVESAPDAIIVGGQSGHIISWNRPAQRMFSYTDEEVLGKPLTLLMPARYREAHQRGLERLRSTGQVSMIARTMELHGLRKDGSEFPLELSLGCWKTKEGTCYILP